MKKLLIITLACLFLSACGPRYVKTPTPPVPSPAPGLDASIIIAQALATSVGAGTYASLADTNESHPTPTPVPPSETERIARAIAWPTALSLTCAGIVLLAIAAALAWNTRDKRQAELKRQELAVQVAQTGIDKLEKVLRSLRAYQQGADVPPRNKGEIKNGE